MLFLTNKSDYITQINNEMIEFLRLLGSFIAAAR